MLRIWWALGCLILSFSIVGAERHLVLPLEQFLIEKSPNEYSQQLDEYQVVSMWDEDRYVSELAGEILYTLSQKFGYKITFYSNLKKKKARKILKRVMVSKYYGQSVFDITHQILGKKDLVKIGKQRVRDLLKVSGDLDSVIMFGYDDAAVLPAQLDHYIDLGRGQNFFIKYKDAQVAYQEFMQQKPKRRAKVKLPPPADQAEYDAHRFKFFKIFALLVEASKIDQPFASTLLRLIDEDSVSTPSRSEIKKRILIIRPKESFSSLLLDPLLGKTFESQFGDDCYDYLTDFYSAERKLINPTIRQAIVPMWEFIEDNTHIDDYIFFHYTNVVALYERFDLGNSDRSGVHAKLTLDRVNGYSQIFEYIKDRGNIDYDALYIAHDSESTRNYGNIQLSFDIDVNAMVLANEGHVDSYQVQKELKRDYPGLLKVCSYRYLQEFIYEDNGADLIDYYDQGKWFRLLNSSVIRNSWIEEDQ